MCIISRKSGDIDLRSEFLHVHGQKLFSRIAIIFDRRIVDGEKSAGAGVDDKNGVWAMIE